MADSGFTDREVLAGLAALCQRRGFTRGGALESLIAESPLPPAEIEALDKQLDRLEETGYVVRRSCPTEFGHEVRISITTAGLYWLWGRA